MLSLRDVDRLAAHKAIAAAALVVKAESAAIRPPKVYDLYADQPFIYLIRDNRTGAILLIGRVTDPS